MLHPLGEMRHDPIHELTCSQRTVVLRVTLGLARKVSIGLGPTWTLPATTHGTWQQYATLPATSGPPPACDLLAPPPPPLPIGCSSPSSAARMDDLPAPTFKQQDDSKFQGCTHVVVVLSHRPLSRSYSELQLEKKYQAKSFG